MFNPTKLLQFKKKWEEFAGRHPKFVLFIKALTQSSLQEGTVVDINITTPDGKTVGSNLRLTQEDIDMLKDIGAMGKDLL